MLNFANFTLPAITPPKLPQPLQAQFHSQKPQQQNHSQQQNITSMNLLDQIQQQQQRLAAATAAHQQNQMPSVSQPSRTPSQPQSQTLIQKLNFPVDQQPFAQYLLNLSSVSPSGSFTNSTPQLPSVGQSPMLAQSDNTSAFTMNSTSAQLAGLKPASNAGIPTSYMGGSIPTGAIPITINNGVNSAYLTQLQTTMALLSQNGGHQMVK